jgi:ribosomal protein S18 acetylase RimI-like enzyme
MVEGLRRMQAHGMATAIVGTGADNLPALQLYGSLGFQLAEQLYTYQKTIA